MKKHTRIMLAAACAFAMVGAFALFGCSSEPKAEEPQNAENQSNAESHEAVELQIFAANSLSKAMEEVQALYKQDHGWVSFADTQYEASGTLNEMLGAGSYADVLITASKATMDTAVNSNYVDAATRFDMFTNELVLVTGENNAAVSDIKLEDLSAGTYTLAVGDANVPAGNYAKQALSTTEPPCWISADGAVGKESSGKEGTFEGTPLAGKVTEGSSVGNVCSYANSGDVDLAMVYSSDVYRFGGVKIVGTVPADTHKKILYPAAICADSKNPAAAQEFLDWAFTNEGAIKIWQEWGFELAA
ncbi:extracellular solute-binding protein [Paraeggerthella hongkongensis]|uniref:molybdate ABC transporter substrate-binding protein n=1 Tax=Paraeggerthella TaxID=651554 RepID=UPI000DF80AD1|nr:MULTISPECIES: extracellular solute-binding protein [Paraeggerthella]MBU5405056.1 extracellular solute-binding protein [Paraeggerthella hongkongensis]MCD2432853.1 extracellular solute-binding protein [Paraeggerthella hominis]RDB55152.1 molybdenum ABC transporter substrate-binding protein [Paraeggerthella hongkongensis]